MKSPEQESKKEAAPLKLIEGVDYYFDSGLMVFTAHFLRNRGYCCNNGCRHCPYPKEQEQKQILK